VANTSSRTLRLLSLLQTQRYWSGHELADRLEISLRTLRRDIDRLRELGYPVRADRGVGGGYQLAPGASLPPLVLDDEEAVALALGLLAGSRWSLAGIAEASVRALAKVIPVMPPRLRRRAEALRTATASPEWPDPEPAADPAMLVVLAQACRDDERVTFGYQSADGTETERRVEPKQLVSAWRRWYLVGYDLARGDWRTFRLDRIRRPAGTGVRFAQRELPGGDPAEYVQRRLAGVERTIPVRAEIAANADDVQQRLGHWGRVTDLGNGRCRLEIETGSAEWAVFTLGVAAGEIIRVEPAEVREAMRNWSGRFDRCLDRDGSGIS
jgi:predicted DNA-binding transcriptional regulator YafY